MAVKTQPALELQRLIDEARLAQREADKCAQAIRDYHKARAEMHSEQYIKVLRRMR